MAPKIREATHAGSWYTDDGHTLSQQLDQWLAQVPSSTTPIGAKSSQAGTVSFPTSNARAIIAPHAGYSYSGPAAAWSYKSADWTNAKRVFLLGPSHHFYLTGAATSACDEYETPLGNLTIDRDLTASIKKEWNLQAMSHKTDEDEHSLEMHLPYIYKMLSLHNNSFKADPRSVPLLPLLIGSTSLSAERIYGRLLAPYLTDPTNLFVVSSDFCHWGSRFRYTYYQPPNGNPKNLRSTSEVQRDYPIHASIKAVDFESMDAVETGKHTEFVEQVQETGNTVCGRHPIGVIMAAMEAAEGLDATFKFVRYERSSEVEDVRDSSVSYCSAFAVL